MTSLRTADQASSAPLVILNVLNYGHFNVHVDNLLHWGLARRLNMVLVARRPDASSTRRDMVAAGRLQLQDIDSVCPGLDWDDPDVARIALGKGCRAIVAALAHLYHPRAVVLVNADEVFFNDPGVAGDDYGFAAPVYGFVTFGRRQAHFGLEDPYTWRLRAVVEKRRPFAGLLSIDERHVAEADPEQQYLHYLPDPYREFAAAEVDATGLEALQEFLAGSCAPIVPILGKFDHRKGNLWILRAVEAHGAARVVILGQRQADPLDDPEIDRIIERLRAANRAYVCFDFVSQTLFMTVLSSGLVPCLPLPYRNHGGSSGLQLLGFEMGIPSLTPDFGLMAERVLAHGLGLVFRLGDYADFESKFLTLLEGGKPFAPALAEFMTNFGEQPLAAALDAALLGLSGPKATLPLGRLLPSSALAERAKASIGRRELSDALAALDSALIQRPKDPTLMLLRLSVHARLGQQSLAAAECMNCLRAGLLDEVLFFVQMMSAFVHLPSESHAAPPEDLGVALACIVPCLPHGALSQESVPRMLDAAWGLLDKASLRAGTRLLKGLLLSFPGDERIIFVLVHSLLRQGRLDEAAAKLEALPKKVSGASNNRLALAYVRLRQDRLDEAGELLDGLLREFPGNVDYQRSRGAVYAKQGQYESAVACFNRLTEGGDVEAYLNLSDCLRYSCRFDEALAALEQGYALGACSEQERAEKRERIRLARLAATGDGPGNCKMR